MMSYSKRKKDKRFPPFVALPKHTIHSKEWKALSPGGKIFYIYLKSKYNAYNNGEIRLYYSELHEIKGLSSPATISKAIKELETLGWVQRTKFGGLYRYMNEFKLTGKFDSCL